MGKHKAREIVREISQRFENEIVESRDGRTVRVVIEEGSEEIDNLSDWAEEEGFDVNVKYSLCFGINGKIGVPITIEIPTERL